MATFQITGPDGKKYRVTGDSPEGAMSALKKMTGQTAAPPASQEPGETWSPANAEFGSLTSYDPGVLGNIGNRLYDAGKAIGLPVSQMRRDGANIDAAVRGAADVATFGYADEIAGYLGSKTGIGGKKDDYEGSRDLQRAIDANDKEQYPGARMAGQLGGGIGLGLATGPYSLSTKFAGSGLIPRTLAGAGDGLIAGGLYGSGSGEDLTSRGIEALKGMGAGAVAGGAFPLVAAGASKAYSSVANALLGRSAAKQAGTSPEVLRMIGNTLDADGTLGPLGQSNMARAGGEAMIADAGPNARAVLDTAIQRGGPGAVSARNAIAERTERAASSLTGSLDQNLGAPEGVTAARSAIREGSAAARGSAYDDAYKAAIDYADPRGQAIESIVKNRVPQSAIAEANALMRAEGHTSSQILAKVADDGSVVFEKLPDVRQLDYITRGLNEVADQADGAGKLGGTTAKGRAYQNLSGEIRDQLRDLVPAYGKALETAADPIRRSKAVELGSKLLSPSMTRDQVEEAVRGMTGPERDALAQGIRSRLDDAMANVTRTVQDGDTGAREAIKAIKDLSSRANREKLTSAIGKEKADALFEEIDRAATSFDLRASVAENSKTYARQAADRKINDMTGTGAVDEVLSGHPVKAGQRVVQAITGRTPEKKLAAQDAVYSQIAEALTRGQGRAQPLFDAVTGLGKKDAATRLKAERIARALSGPRLAYPAATQLLELQRSR